MDTKDDLEFKFDDEDDDDDMLVAMLPDSVTTPTNSPSCATSTITANPVQSLPPATETGNLHKPMLQLQG